MATSANSRAGTVTRTVSREYFHCIVSGWAYQTWKNKESGRRRRSWYRALEELGFAYVFLADADRQLAVRIRAAQIHERQKDADALEDWREAEEEASRFYDVRD